MRTEAYDPNAKLNSKQLKKTDCGTAISPDSSESSFQIDESFAAFLDSIPQPDQELVDQIAKELYCAPLDSSPSIDVDGLSDQSQSSLNSRESSLTSPRSEISTLVSNPSNHSGASTSRETNGGERGSEESQSRVESHRIGSESNTKESKKPSVVHVHIHPEEQDALFDTLNLNTSNREANLQRLIASPKSTIRRKHRRTDFDGEREKRDKSDTPGAITSRGYRKRKKEEMEELLSQKEALFALNLSLQEENNALKAQIQYLKETVAAKNDALEIAKNLIKSHEISDNSRGKETSRVEERPIMTKVVKKRKQSFDKAIKEEICDGVNDGGPLLAPMPGGRCTKFTQLTPPPKLVL